MKNTELVDYFKPIFPSEPEQKAAVRERFKTYVDSVAYVKTENGVKYVCLKKKFKDFKKEVEKDDENSSGQVSGSDASPGGVHASSSYSQVPHVSVSLADSNQDKNECYVCLVEVDDMGNRGSVKREKRDSKKQQEKSPGIPVINVLVPSPIPAREEVFILPELENTGSTKEGGAIESRQVSTSDELKVLQDEEEKVEDDATQSPTTPSGSRKHFLEVMMCTSPEIRRSLVRKNSLCDSDTASLASSNLEDDRNLVTLDPLEHEWMLCASDAEWGSLQKLLASDPGLVLKKDFVTGFTCLHWAAKQGKPELIALIINFSKLHNIPVNVDVRSSTGYTPLHIAAMHNHMEVVKLLVGAYNADVEIRDYSGRKACQYLTDNASVDIRDIIGAYVIETEDKPVAEGKRWKFSKVLQAKAIPIRRLNSTGDSDSVDGGEREKPMRRRSSLGRMKPKFQKLKWRTSQLVHSTTFHGVEDLEKQRKGAARPKTSFFG